MLFKLVCASFDKLCALAIRLLLAIRAMHAERVN